MIFKLNCLEIEGNDLKMVSLFINKDFLMKCVCKKYTINNAN